MQQPSYRSKCQRIGVPKQYLDITLIPGQYKIYSPAMAFDLPKKFKVWHIIIEHKVNIEVVTKNR